MVCFQVEVNGQKACAAGIGSAGSLGVHLTWLKPNTADAAQPAAEQMTLTVSGFMQPHGQLEWLMCRWLDRPLHAGDEIVIRIVDQDAPCDPPTTQGHIGNLLRPDPQQLLGQVQKAYSALQQEVDKKADDSYTI